MRDGKCPLCEFSKWCEVLLGPTNAGNYIYRYFEAAKLNGKLGKCEDALRCVERGLQIDEDCLGMDHELYQKSLKDTEALRGV